MSGTLTVGVLRGTLPEGASAFDEFSTEDDSACTEYVVLFYFIVIHDPCLLTHSAPNGYCGITQNLTFTRAVTEHNVTISIQNDNCVESL